MTRVNLDLPEAVFSARHLPRCVICKHGQTKPGLVTETLDRDECIVVIKKVPAAVCDNCGEYYLSDAITKEVPERAEIAQYCVPSKLS